MARLPQPGSDNGTWGDVLNDYLLQAHTADGSLKADSVTSAQIQDGAIAESQLDSAVQTKLNAVAGDWNTLVNKPAVVAAGVNQSAARTAIGAFAASDMIDEDSMVSNSATKVPTQRSVKAYVDAKSIRQIIYIDEIDCGDGVHADGGAYRAAIEVEGDMVRLLGYVSIDFGSEALVENQKLFTLPANILPSSVIQMPWSMVMMGSKGDPNIYSAQSVYIGGDDLDELWMGPVGSLTEPAGYYLYLNGVEWRLG